MQTLSKQRVRCSRVGFAVALAVAGSTSEAAVTGGSARVSTVVQELIDAMPASVTSASEEADLLSGVFPASTRGELVSVDLNDVLIAQGYGLARLDDPTIRPQANPAEFRLEAACYSNDDKITYIVESTATQERRILFTAESDPEVAFDGNAPRTIESTVFLSGAMILWATVPSADLSGLEGEVTVTVMDDTPNTLFEGSISFLTSGATERAFATTGPITVTVMSLDDLIASGEVDDITLRALRRIEATGSLLLLALQEQAHRYRYDVVADTALVLTARMSLHLRTPPGGVGLAATLGGPFENLAAFVTDGISDVNGTGVQRAVNAAAGLTAPPDPPAPPALSLCGVFGFEAMLWLAAPVAIGRSRLRRRQR